MLFRRSVVLLARGGAYETKALVSEYKTVLIAQQDA